MDEEAKPMAMKYKEVKFYWFEPAEDRKAELYECTELRGVVLVRDGADGEEMVLDIQDSRGASPYLVVGRRPAGKTYFVGVNAAANRTSKVTASWAAVDNSGYVGRWLEDNVEYRFHFSVANPPTQ